jgi:hypothetical protein
MNTKHQATAGSSFQRIEGISHSWPSMNTKHQATAGSPFQRIEGISHSWPSMIYETSGYGCIFLPADRRDIVDLRWTRNIRLRLHHPSSGQKGYSWPWMNTKHQATVTSSWSIIYQRFSTCVRGSLLAMELIFVIPQMLLTVLCDLSKVEKWDMSHTSLVPEWRILSALPILFLDVLLRHRDSFTLSCH